MISFDEYWKGLIKANSMLSNGENKMKISVASLRKQLKKAFDEGRTPLFSAMHDKDKQEKDFDKIFDSFSGLFSNMDKIVKKSKGKE